MKIVICAIPAILAAVLVTSPFSTRNDADDREDAAGQREAPDEAARTQPAPQPQPEFRLTDRQGPHLAEPRQERVLVGNRQEAAGELEYAGGPAFNRPAAGGDTEDRLTEQQAPLLAAEAARELALADQGQPREADGGWQVVHQRRRDDERETQRNRRRADPDQLAREQEAQREELRQRQAQQLEQFLELQRRQYEQLLEQQEQVMAEAGPQRDVPPAQSLQQTDARGDVLFEERDPFEADQDVQETYGYDTRPQPDPYPDDGSSEGNRVYRSNRRDTFEIPLPGGRAFRFRLW
jgi:hypothetical protein